MKRRNISGIFIFDKFEDEEKQTPTCFEDCNPKTQDKWLASLDNEALINLAKELANTLVEVCDQFNIMKQ